LIAHETFLNLTGRRRLPLIRQVEAAECGLACLGMVAGWHGYDTDLAALRRLFPISLKGTTLRNLIEIAAKLNMGSRALRCELDDLSKLRLPCILHWEFDHFVVLKKVSGGRVWLHDPAIGSRICALADVSRSFTGVALELSPTGSFVKRRERNPVKLATLWNWTPDASKAFIQGLLLSVLLELVVILSPFYMQLVIDEAILKSDDYLLTGLAVGFGGLCVFNVAAGALRSLVFQYLANILSFDMEARLFHHLIRLPLDFFQKRSLGDLLQRFHALEPIKQIIVNGGIAAILDGSLALFTGALMLIYSVKLGCIVIGTLALYLGIRVGALSIGRRLSADSMIAEAREQSKFLETIRAIQTIKVSGGEVSRENLWRNFYADKLNSNIRIGNLNIAYQNLSSLLSGLSDVLILYLAARDAMGGLMTIGVISAFMAYKGQFTSRLVSLVDQAIQFRMLDVHLERVGDIALATREGAMEAGAISDREIAGRIEARGLTFRYTPNEPAIIESLDLTIAPGEFIAIVGASGVGKSTLVKLLLGLNQPTEGKLLIDGLTVEAIGTETIRRQLGVVMQEDQLLTGSVAENIAIFDERMDMARVREAASLAGVDAEIMSFPMQYNSLVGDMGTSLSSGQRQRVLIARALYRNPKILVLDEGTAHLDPVSEARICAVMKTMPITRIAVAHSLALARAADRILELRGGSLHETKQMIADR
jgi:ATP-binding cassette subfamily B protein RaxB